VGTTGRPGGAGKRMFSITRRGKSKKRNLITGPSTGGETKHAGSGIGWSAKPINNRRESKDGEFSHHFKGACPKASQREGGRPFKVCMRKGGPQTPFWGHFLFEKVRKNTVFKFARRKVG